MEVYGSSMPLSLFEPAIMSLQMQRRFALSELLLCRKRIAEGIERMNDDSKNGRPDYQFGPIWKHL